MDRLTQFFNWHVGGIFEISDLLDILLAAAFFFLTITALRRSIAPHTYAAVLGGTVLLVGVYKGAHYFEMYLIERLVEGLLIVFPIGLLIIFQAEIRRLFDQMGWWRRARSASTSVPLVDLLTEAAGHLAELKVGALIALRGGESWDRHVKGGIAVDALASLPLIYSIFDPSSPGHDGAVLIEGERLSRFGVHLPLSARAPEVSSAGGTRHAAALGLAECCDALVIVVSEERGTISLAEKGRLEEMPSVGRLKRRLDRFWRQQVAGERETQRVWWRRPAWSTAAVSVVLAVSLWFLFAQQVVHQEVFRTYDVPVEFRNLPSVWQLQEPIPMSVRVTLSGSRAAFRQLQPEEMSLSFDLEEVREEQVTLEVTSNNLRLPSGLHLYRAEPALLKLMMQRKKKKTAGGKQ